MKSTLIVGIGASLLTAGIAKPNRDKTLHLERQTYCSSMRMTWDMETWNATTARK